ncbi:amino acid adenylation domain-containing protein [Alcaligenaceae bacterium]|nr:amino acid adenylation domain-containing protein [Alcaligenaceae bacterium]
MNDQARQALHERISRLDADQVVALVTGLQQRIDTLRAEQSGRGDVAPVAVVGLGCRFPGADDAAAFRRLLREGIDAIGDPPLDRPERDALPRGGYVQGIDRFDAAFFGMRDSEAAHMDPQHRLMLEVAWHALEDAGVADASRRPRSTGVFVGISTHDYEARFHAPGQGFTPQATTGNSASAAAGRLAHLLDVTGPALAIDTACSSSLVAVHAACRSLQAGESDMAIAGGVNALVSDAWTRGFAAAGMLSPSQACRTFDAAADGYVRGEGAGFVVLKRLPDALRDGDRIRAVIRGGAVNHDGRASSLTAPNASAQAALICAALKDADLRPADVQVVECHGTGTPLGDPIEAQALADAYGADRADALLLGAVKTNIGHLESAAGIAGLIKLVLMLESGQLPPTLHQSSPNPRIAWDKLPLRVVDRAQPWPAAPTRRAAVSSFGFSGTNAHLILEAAPARDSSAAATRRSGPLVLPLSAPDEPGLARMGQRLADWMTSGDADPRGVAASLALGRHGLPVRAAVAGDDLDALVAGLNDVAAGQTPAGGARGTAMQAAPRIAFLFTGQGSQWPGMGKGLYEDDPVFRRVVDHCAAVVDPLIGDSLIRLMFDEPRDGPSLADTRIAQPALFTLGYALAERLAAWGVEPEFVIGHSLGEYIAACRAGVFSLDDALKLVAERGRLMGAAAEGGAMAAVFAPPSCLEGLPDGLAASIDLAAVNAHDECVISGASDAIGRVCNALERQGIASQLLRTSHAFHSRLMEPALEPFARVLSGTKLARPRLALISNSTGSAEAAFDTPGYWTDHIRQPVRFAEGVGALARMGANVLIEIGAAPNLIGSAGRCPDFGDAPPALVPTLRRNQPAWRSLGNLLSQLHVAGVPLRWEALYDRSERREAPGYPFEPRSHWIPLMDVGVRPVGSDPFEGAGVGVRPRTGSDPSDAATAMTDGVRPYGSDPSGPLNKADVAAFMARALQLPAADQSSDRGFLEMGVDSLALTEAVAAMERKWGISIPRRALFESLNTPLRLIEHVLAEAGAARGVRPRMGSDPNHKSAALSGGVRPRTGSDPGNPGSDPSTLTPAQLNGLAEFSEGYIRRSQASREQRSRFGKYLADSRAVAGFRPETKGMLYPIVGARAQGSELFDVDGNRYVDIAMGFGVQLFGHSPAFIIEAVSRHLGDRGMFIGPQAHLAGEVAQRLCRLTGNARAAFCNSGTEAVMTALRLARHATGRQRVAIFQGSYHGHFDGVLAQLGPDGNAVPMAGGTPPGMAEDILLLDYGDEAGALEILAREGQSLAAVLVEPVQGRRPDRQPREFLQRLRTLTRSTGTALIFDEVLLGFRVALGGAQAWAGVRADLVTYGKIVGGGLPIGVVAGDAQYLDALDGGAWPLDGAGAPRDGRTFFAGTFNKNPLAMAASLAVLEYLESAGPGLQETLNERTRVFVERLNRVLEEEGGGISVHSFSSLFRFVGASDLFYNHMIQNGVYVWEGRTCFLSTAHSAEDLDKIESAVRDSVRGMRARGMLAPPASTAGPDPAALLRGPEHLPAAPGQTALRMLAAFSPEASAAYNQTLVFDLRGELEPSALKTALEAVCRRHEALRSTFPEDGETQVVHADLAPDFRLLRWTDAETVFQHWLDGIALVPVDLEHGPMLTAWLVEFEPEHHRLVLIMPHLIVDGWSMQVIALELAELYNAALRGRAPDLAEAVPYRRYAAHARRRAEDAEPAGYWHELYRTVPPPLDLPADRPRPALQSYAGARASLRVPLDLRSRLEALGRQAGCSLFSVCLAAYGKLLARLSGRRDLAIAIFSAGQPELAAPALVGYCVGVLPLRMDMDESQPQAALIAQAQRAVVQGMAHRDYPYARLLKGLKLRRDPSRPPLASVSFNLDRVDALPRFDGLDACIDANAHGAVRWDLNWNILADADGLHIDAFYNRDLFDAGRVESWLRQYVVILEAFVQGDADAASPASATEAGDIQSLAERVAHAALETPSSLALRDGRGAVDYATLDAEAHALAQALAGSGIVAGDRVAFRLPRGLGPAVAMLAAMRLGAAFVPLDEDHPDAHHAYVLEDSGAKVLVIEEGARAAFDGVAVLAWRRGQKAVGRMPPPARVSARDLAYVLYTSGSTGRPKGVMVPHGAIATYVPALLQRLGMPGPMSFAMVSSFAADLGYTSVFGALWSGGALHAIDAETARDPEALASWSVQTPYDVLKIVPAHLAALLDAPNAKELLPRRGLIMGGDVLAWRLVDRLRSLGATCRIFNHYGPTEATIGACMTEALPELRRDGDHAVPIGRALDGYDVAILDGDERPMPDGSEGEIVISGPAVAAGYTRPEPAGSERFRRSENGMRSYRSGDLGRRRPDGCIDFIGRGDDMVKIRGHRIEPAGLAEALRAHAGVRDAVVLVDRRDGREPVLLAAVASDVDGHALRAWLSERVPAAMVPQRIQSLPALPLTANGKIDRQALLASSPMAAAQTGSDADGDASAADGSVLDQICELWREILEAPSLGPDDDFFALGGDSIMAIQIVGRARRLGWALTPAQVFQAPTPRRLAQLAMPVGGMAGREPVQEAVPLTPIQQWFNETPMPDRNRWCLAAVFRYAGRVGEPGLLDVARALQSTHDALRMRWMPTADGVAQQVAAAGDPCVRVAQAEGLGGPDLAIREDALADELMDSLDLAEGRVFALGALQVSAEHARLVVVVHHAVSDMVSWSILAEDLDAGLSSGSASIRAASTSWSWWAKKLPDRVQAASASLELWKDMLSLAADYVPLPVDHPGLPNTEGEAADRKLVMPAQASADLLNGMASVFGLRPHEAVLAAVGLGMASWAGGACLLDMEGHGRQPSDSSIDLSRTIGWFTTRYPFAMPAASDDVPAWVIALKERLRSIPDGGLSYGLLRYGGHAVLRAEPPASFNFVGEIKQFGSKGLALQRLAPGTERSAAASRRHLLAFDAWLEEGSIVLSCRHSPRHEAATVDALLESVRQMALRLSAACVESASAVYTPSDFTGMEFSQDELDALMGQINDAGMEKGMPQP